MISKSGKIAKKAIKITNTNLTEVILQRERDYEGNSENVNKCQK